MDAPSVFLVPNDLDAEEVSKMEMLLQSLGHQPTTVTDLSMLAGVNSHSIVFCNFGGEVFEYLLQLPCRIYGRPVLLSLALERRPLPDARVQYARVLEGKRFLCSGIPLETLPILQKQLEWLGAAIDSELGPDTTDIIAPTVTPDVKAGQGRCAVTHPDWIQDCWCLAADPSSAAQLGSSMKAFKLPALTGCAVMVSPDGISEKTRSSLVVLAQRMGATNLTVVTDACTHYVTNVLSGVEYIHAIAMGCHIVRSQWLFSCFQQNRWCDETAHLAATPAECVAMDCDVTMSSKRARVGADQTVDTSMMEVLLSPSATVAAGGCASSKRKREEEERSRLDADASPVRLELDPQLRAAAGMTRKHHHIAELLEKEGNYRDSLATIIEVFKLPLETEGLHRDRACESIFNNIATLLDLSKGILAELSERVRDYNDATTCIADIFMSKLSVLSREYGRYVSIQQNSKTLLDKKMTKAPFAAFVKQCEQNPRCHRESLAALLMHPVQHIGRYKLLLKDICKATAPEHPDALSLQQLHDELGTLMSGVNVETHKQARLEEMLRVTQEIDGAKATLVTSKRHLVGQHHVRIRNLDGSRKRACLFLFSDTLLLALRTKTTLTGTLTKRLCKPYRQIAAGKLGNIDAHDLTGERGQPQVVFAVRYGPGCDGGIQNFYLEARSEDEKGKILADIRATLVAGPFELTQKMKEDAQAGPDRAGHINRNASRLLPEQARPALQTPTATPVHAHTHAHAHAHAHTHMSEGPSSVTRAEMGAEEPAEVDLDTTLGGEAGPASACAMRPRLTTVSFATRPGSFTSLTSADISLDGSMLVSPRFRDRTNSSVKENEENPEMRRKRAETVSTATGQGKVTRRRTWKEFFSLNGSRPKLDDDTDIHVKRASSFQDKILQRGGETNV